MTTYVALLRGINVGGNQMIAMADLRAVLADMGFADVRTLLQSGNVVFRAGAQAPARLESRLEKAIGARFGFTPDLHVRTGDEWRDVVAGNPFPAEAKADPGHLLVTFFRAPLDAAKVKALQAAITGPELVRSRGRHLYMTFPNGVGTSRAPVLADKTLGVRGTARNWNTVRKLAALVGE
jgi:uncharacterized protein (DUF1697 family)